MGRSPPPQSVNGHEGKLVMTEREKPADEAEDDVQRKFREALDRKNAKAGESHGEQGRGRGVGPSSNDKTKRQFRRKSGG